MRHLSLAIVLSFGLVSAASAAPVTLVGTTVSYTYDDSQAAIALFGAPTLVGDAVRFLPTSFRAESIDGFGVNTGTNTDSVSATFVFDRVFSNNGTDNILDLLVVERGDYEITNGDSVSGDLYLQAVNNDPNFIADFTSDVDAIDFSGDSGGKQLWTMSADIKPLDDVFFWYGPSNDIAVSIQNTLTATTNAQGEVAWIQKKLAFGASTSGPVVLPPVPVPAAAWLFGSALGLLGWVRRRA